MGIRPINNIVDITNYVMEEYGQPMHAYDLNKIRGHKIVVKRANDGDVYTTLDGQERKLDKDVLMINDAEGPVGIAGIMGGENSMVTDDIQTMLLRQLHLMEQISVFLLRESVLEQMLPVSLKKVLTQRTH